MKNQTTVTTTQFGKLTFNLKLGKLRWTPNDQGKEIVRMAARGSKISYDKAGQGLVNDMGRRVIAHLKSNLQGKDAL